jgi:uncharacterized protein
MIRLTRVTAVALAVLLSACAQMPTDTRQRLVVQVSDDSPKTWHQALNNAANVQKELGKENVDVRIVVYGNGIGMLKMDSEVGGRVKQAIDGGMTVVACENTMKARKITRADMLPYSGYVKAGIIDIMQRQRDGYAYVRP